VAASIPALVDPALLRWARETAGLAVPAASRRLGIEEDELFAWEGGEAHATIDQLRTAAKVYKRTLAVFFLDSPPGGFDTLRDFRRVAGSPAGAWSPELHADYRRAHVQRDNVLELLEMEDRQPELSWRFQGTASDHGDDAAFAAAIRAHLVAATAAKLRGTEDRYAHFNYWVGALESLGVLVLHSRGGGVSQEEMRALSLYFDEVPVVMLNGADAVRGRLFSLLHEYAHLLLHSEGVCDLVTARRTLNPDVALEARCNEIAAEVLMPASAVLRSDVVRERQSSGGDWDYDSLAEAAAPFGTSAESFLLRLVTLGLVGQGFYDAKRAEFRLAYETHERSVHDHGGDWYRSAARDLGKGYVRLVADAYARRVIDSLTAATYLDGKVGQIERIAAAAGFTAG